MRIISGKFKGRRLVSFDADHIRPTTDRVKESIFNILQSQWDGARVLDLFAGTGNLSIEALSRGASVVVSVESHVKSLKIMTDNMKLLGIQKDEMQTVKSDVFSYLSKYSSDPFDIVLADPPFTEKIAHKVMTQLSLSKVFHRGTILIVESSKHETVEEHYKNLARFDSRNFGDKLVSFYRQSESQNDQTSQSPNS